MAVVQLRNSTEGRAYVDRKNASGKTSMEAMRCLRRRLSDLIYKLMLDAFVPRLTTEGSRKDAEAPGWCLAVRCEASPDVAPARADPVTPVRLDPVPVRILAICARLWSRRPR